MPEPTRAKLKERIERQGMEMLELEMEMDALREEVLDLQRLLIQYQRWHIQSLTRQEEE